jgi:diguanylate cyclase (GGDEF)-like protein/PAS domain S-box-containing protein
MNLRERALQALRRGGFELAEKALANGDLSVAELMECLRVYQAELEIQNQELRQSQIEAENASQRFSRLFHTLPVPAIVVDGRGIIREANHQALNYFRFKPHHLRQHFFHRLVHVTSEGTVQAAFLQAQVEDQSTVEEVAFRSGTQTTLIGSLHISRLPPANNQIEEFLCVVVDQSEQLRRRNLHQRVRQQLELILSSVPIAIYATDIKQERLLYANREGQTLFQIKGTSSSKSSPQINALKQTNLTTFWDEHREDVPSWKIEDIPEHRFQGPEGNLILHTRRTAMLDTDGRPSWLLCASQDITQQKTMEQELIRSRDLFRRVLASLDQAVMLVDPSMQRITECNPCTQTLFGNDREATLSQPLQQLFPNDAAFRCFQEQAARDCQTQGYARGTVQMRRDCGEIFPAEFFVRPLDDHPTASGLVCVFRDVTERWQAEEQLRRSDLVFTHSPAGIMLCDANQHILSVNRAFTTITGYSAEEVLGQTPRLLSSGRHAPAFFRDLWASVNSTGLWRGEIWNRHKNGNLICQQLTISVIRHPDGSVQSYLGIYEDRTPHYQAELRFQHLAQHDSLTDLPNRMLLQDRLSQALARARRNGSRLAVLFLDLDRFKTINDSLGHSIGDGVLQEVARRLVQAVRASDTVARIGGDEFVVLLNDIDNAESAIRVASKLRDRLSEVYHIGPHELFLSGSVGIAVYPDNGEDTETLLKHADSAMYSAKESGRNTFCFFKPSMTGNAIERLRLEQDLRRAIEMNHLQLVYQPQAETRTGRVIGAEALLRWQRNGKEWVRPEEFIPVAEQTGLIVPIGRWVLEQTCKQILQWRDSGLPLLPVAVNISGVQLIQGDFADLVQSILQAYGLPGSLLEVELTESVLMKQIGTAIATMRQLQDLGVRLALDDFGTGYSSLSCLKQFPVSRLKIDRSFIRQLLCDGNDRAIVEAVIAIAHRLNLAPIAEGVEELQQYNWLVEQGCDQVQGYLISRPLTVQMYEQVLSQQIVPIPRKP